MTPAQSTFLTAARAYVLARETSAGDTASKYRRCVKAWSALVRSEKPENKEAA